MGVYQDQIVPVLINLTMRRRDLAAYRSHIIPAADGRVLEIGIGSGFNLPFYCRDVEHLIGLDPSPKLLSMARRNLRPNTPFSRGTSRLPIAPVAPAKKIFMSPTPHGTFPAKSLVGTISARITSNRASSYRFHQIVR